MHYNAIIMAVQYTVHGHIIFLHFMSQCLNYMNLPWVVFKDRGLGFRLIYVSVRFNWFFLTIFVICQSQVTSWHTQQPLVSAVCVVGILKVL
jgi:hypothetical protein